MIQTPNRGRSFVKSAQDTTAAQLTTTPTPAMYVIVENDEDNTVDLLVGFSNDQVHQLSPSDAITIPIDDASKIYTKTVSGTANVNWSVVSYGPV